MTKISYVIPCYGSELSIESVIDDIKKVISTRPEKLDYEIILVNDNSPDNVWDVISKMSKEDSKIRGFRLSKNFGQHAALMAGYKKATGDIIISLDDDGQTPASESLTLIDKLMEGYDVVYGRYQERKDSSFRKLGTYVNKKMAEVLVGKPKNVEITSFYAIRRYVVEEMIKYDNPYPYVAGLVFRTTSNCVNVTIKHETRTAGKSGYTLKKLLSLWLNGFTSFSVKPLRIATIMGFIFSLIGFIFIIYTIIERILNPQLPAGYAVTISIVLLIGGITMGMLGIIGEYIGRLYISINKAPQYVIKEDTDSNK